MIALLVPLMLVALQPAAADPVPHDPPAEGFEAAARRAVEADFVNMFRPYADGGAMSAWEAPIFSAETTALIAAWREVAPQDEPDALSQGDWLCQCQDWDESAFTAAITALEFTAEDAATVDAVVDLGFATNALRRERLLLKREDGAWKIDDLVAESFPDGLKQTLREAIAAGAGERG